MLCYVGKNTGSALGEIRVQILALPLTLILSFSSLWTRAPHLQTHREDAWDPVWRKRWHVAAPFVPTPCSRAVLPSTQENV